VPDSPIVLRDLLGVAELEARLARIAAHPNPEWAPETDGLKPHADRVSTALFGLTEDETFFDRSIYDFDDEWEYDEHEVQRFHTEWERHFEFLYVNDPEAEALVWEAMGWDISDGIGADLRCLEHLCRQMVCATKGLKGRLPGAPMSDAELESRAGEIEAKLATEAASFRSQRRR
jgi:hypothetical protein